MQEDESLQLSLKFAVEERSALQQLSACSYPPAALIQLAALSEVAFEDCLEYPTVETLVRFIQCRVTSAQGVMFAIHIVDCPSYIVRYQESEPLFRAAYEAGSRPCFRSINQAYTSNTIKCFERPRQSEFPQVTIPFLHSVGGLTPLQKQTDKVKFTDDFTIIKQAP